MVFLKDVFEFDFKVGPHLATHVYEGPSILGNIYYIWYINEVTTWNNYSDLEEMPLKSLYEAERVSNQLFINEHVFRDHLIQVRTRMFELDGRLVLIHVLAIFKYAKAVVLLQYSWWLSLVPIPCCQILQPCISHCPQKRGNRTKIIIYSRMSIGISGLSFALKASRISSKPIRIYEKDAKLGGWIQTVRTDYGKGSIWSSNCRRDTTRNMTHIIWVI